MLIDLSLLEKEYFERRPDLEDPRQQSASAPAGIAGRPSTARFTEAHILAIRSLSG
jgi:phosphoglucomutase